MDLFIDLQVKKMFQQLCNQFRQFAQSVKQITDTRGLHSRACFKQDKTRQDWKSLPELVVLGKDYCFLVLLLEKIRDKSGNSEY